VPRVDERSTSGAAGIVSADKTGCSAAICSRFAAEEFGLDVLADGIETDSQNETRFIVVRQRKASVPLNSPGGGSTGLLVMKLPETVQVADLAKLGERCNIRLASCKDQSDWVIAHVNELKSGQERVAEFVRELASLNVKVWDWGRWEVNSVAYSDS
jgi:hypothetical protein